MIPVYLIEPLTADVGHWIAYTIKEEFLGKQNIVQSFYDGLALWKIRLHLQ